jgi:hypothetical protein
VETSLAAALSVIWATTSFVSQKVFITLFCNSQFPYKSFNLFLTLVMMKDKSTDLCGNILEEHFLWENLVRSGCLTVRKLICRASGLNLIEKGVKFEMLMQRSLLHSTIFTSNIKAFV